MLDEHWTGLLPNYVLTGFPSTAFGGLVDSGMAVGWLHLAAAFAKRSFLGKAWITVSTFDLTSPEAAENPLAPHLLRRWRRADRRRSRAATPAERAENTDRPEMRAVALRPAKRPR